MVFKRLLGAIGVAGPEVDTVLDTGVALPGGPLSGQVHLRGGGTAVEIEHIGLELVARVEAEHGEGESEGTVVFARFTVGGGLRLGEEEQRSVPFSVPLPWETPITELYGQPLGVALGVRTELAVAGATDQGDLDPLAVRPLPVQEAVLEAFGRLGFGFRSADLEHGRIGGTGQRLPFYQEIELAPAVQYAHAVDEIELTFLAAPERVEIVLEADKRGGLLSSGHDTLVRFTAGHQDVHTRDWAADVDGWVGQLVEHRTAHGAQMAYGGHDPYAVHGHHGDHHGHHDGHHSGIGTAVAAGAAGLAVGVVGGMVAAEVVDEIGDFFEGEED
ncbi:sporulation protein [Streptomyces chiangmaiensis]|uniref:Sporulation protein n=1 Tax=Streptomyces chiangmaiensis TaxID=766497 RepID=A0ABU7FMT9_9ACTN|nr:sporulation protein [Streptomyces chiangmaiensis]MED7825389.1 sporulation protein [Streptomyces chiangmaiensis]